MRQATTLLRILFLLPAVMLAFAAYFFRSFSAEFWPFGNGVFFALITLSLYSLWFFVGGHSELHRTIMGWSVITANSAGCAGTIVGTIVAVIRWPVSSLAPMYGLLHTGPLCFSAGAFLGVVIGIFMSRKSTA